MPFVLINCPSRLRSVCVVWSFNSGLSLTTCLLLPYRLNDLHMCVERSITMCVSLPTITRTCKLYILHPHTYSYIRTYMHILWVYHVTVIMQINLADNEQNHMFIRLSVTACFHYASVNYCTSSLEIFVEF